MERTPSPPKRPTTLRSLLYDAGWSRRRLAREIGVSPQTAGRIFDGLRPLSLPEADQLAVTFTGLLGRSVSALDFLDREN